MIEVVPGGSIAENAFYPANYRRNVFGHSRPALTIDCLASVFGRRRRRRRRRRVGCCNGRAVWPGHRKHTLNTQLGYIVAANRAGYCTGNTATAIGTPVRIPVPWTTNPFLFLFPLPYQPNRRLSATINRDAPSILRSRWCTNYSLSSIILLDGSRLKI